MEIPNYHMFYDHQILRLHIKKQYYKQTNIHKSRSHFNGNHVRICRRGFRFEHVHYPLTMGAYSGNVYHQHIEIKDCFQTLSLSIYKIQETTIRKGYNKVVR